MIIPIVQTKSEIANSVKKDLILEVELNGKMKFDQILDTINQKMGICYRLLNANLEYIDGNNFGSFQLRIYATHEESQQVEFFLNKNKLLNTTVEYTCRKYS